MPAPRVTRRATARAADGQIVVVEDRDGLRAGAVEVDRAAGDGVARGNTIGIKRPRQLQSCRSREAPW